MWKEWDPAVVEEDFKVLAAHGMTAIRVFPLWSDFQPVTMLRKCNSRPGQYCGKNETLLPPDSDGMDEDMLARFRTLADLAEKYQLKLIVGLLTGWMSGAMFGPPALSGKNILTDFLALKLEKMFIDGFVSALKDHVAIKAWEPGNVCNCMSACDENAAWNWLNMVTSAIRLADPTRPVYAGMHGASDDWRKPFNLIQHQDLCDAVTTHPYPAFTPHCG
ncbi:MAG: beta-mannanase, partial [Lentisphaeria bacterium]|nr:beta-mannanase [Lentisphaeria bacterium]